MVNTWMSKQVSTWFKKKTNKTEKQQWNNPEWVTTITNKNLADNDDFFFYCCIITDKFYSLVHTSLLPNV